jgi:hypothetical protein
MFEKIKLVFIGIIIGFLFSVYLFFYLFVVKTSNENSIKSKDTTTDIKENDLLLLKKALSSIPTLRLGENEIVDENFNHISDMEGKMKVTKDILDKLTLESSTNSSFFNIQIMERIFSDCSKDVKNKIKEIKILSTFVHDLGKAFNNFSKDLARISLISKTQRKKLNINIESKDNENRTSISSNDNGDNDISDYETLLFDSWWQSISAYLDRLSQDQEIFAEKLTKDIYSKFTNSYASLCIIEKKLSMEGLNQLNILKEQNSNTELKLKERDRCREKYDKVTIDTNTNVNTTTTPSTTVTTTDNDNIDNNDGKLDNSKIDSSISSPNQSINNSDISKRNVFSIGSRFVKEGMKFSQRISDSISSTNTESDYNSKLNIKYQTSEYNYQIQKEKLLLCQQDYMVELPRIILEFQSTSIVTMFDLRGLLLLFVEGSKTTQLMSSSGIQLLKDEISATHPTVLFPRRGYEEILIKLNGDVDELLHSIDNTNVSNIETNASTTNDSNEYNNKEDKKTYKLPSIDMTKEEAAILSASAPSQIHILANTLNNSIGMNSYLSSYFSIN